MEVSFDISSAERRIVSKIVKRGMALDVKLENDDKWSKLSCEMDIIATHANGNPLRLNSFLEADDFNFAHDWYGIRNCLDRRTGQMMRHFSPRFSQPVEEAA